MTICRSLIGFANHWLRNNRKYKVLRCESITRKIKDGQIEMDSTAFHQSLFGENDYVRGLRSVFLVLSKQIKLCNIFPLREKNHESNFRLVILIRAGFG